MVEQCNSVVEQCGTVWHSLIEQWNSVVEQCEIEWWNSDT